MTPLENAQYVLSQDQFSLWMGVSLIEIKENYCLIKMPIREEMINGLKTVHGGVTFSFAESALAFSSLNSGEAAVALNCTINFTQAVKLGDVLTAESIMLTNTKKTAVFDIRITNQDEKVVAAFRGTVYKLGKNIREL